MDGVAELGESRRGLELIGRVAQTAREALDGDADEAGGSGAYFYCRALVTCGRAALALGDAAAADRHFDEAFTRLSALNNYDLIDLLQETGAIAGQLEGASRYALARRVLEAAEAPVDAGAHDRFAVELVEQVATETVRGESAFASALKRWRGREERAIRDRVAHQGLDA